MRTDIATRVYPRYVHRKAAGETVCYDRWLGTVSYGEPAARLGAEELTGSDERAPLKVYYDPTYRCNLHCRHCITESSGHADTSGELEPARAHELMEELGRAGVFELQVGGGEPLCHPAIFPLLGAARRAGLNVVLSTNGTLLTPALARRLAALGLLEVRVSFDGARDFHQKIRGPGTYGMALAAASMLAESGARVVARITLCRGCEEGLPELFADLAAVGVKRVKAVAVKDVGRASRSENRWLLGYRTDRASAESLQALGARHGMVVELSSDDFSVSRTEARDRKPRYRGARNCGSGFETAYVSPRGDVHPCAGMRCRTFGNVRESSFMHVWTGPAALAYRKAASRCTHERLCRGLGKDPCVSPGA